MRYCIDYRGLNAVTHKANYPHPRIDSCLDSLGGNTLFSCLDMRSSYWQVKVKDEDVDKTCFVTRKGIFGFKVLPFGLCNAPSTFQRLVDLTLAGLTWEVCLAYLDDLVVFSRTFTEHLDRLQLVFDRLEEANLKLKPSKCSLFQERVKFFGSIVSANGVEPDPEKVQAVANWPRPQNLTEVRSFVALASYYRRHIQSFAEIARPLHELTKKNARFVWGQRQEDAFLALKHSLINAPVLAMPIDGGGYVLDTDANQFSEGCVLQQWQNGILKVIGYASKAFSAAEIRYCVTRRELAAVIYGLKYYRHFLLGFPFVLRTDHSALTHLMRTPNPVAQSARYLDTLAEYQFTVQYRPGLSHKNADSLSRRPCDRGPDQPLCKQCGPVHPPLEGEADPVDSGSTSGNDTFVKSRMDHEDFSDEQATHAAMPIYSESAQPASDDEPIRPQAAAVENGTDPDQTQLSGVGVAFITEVVLQEHQTHDAAIRTVRSWMEAPDKGPDSNELHILNPEIQHLWAQRQTLEVKNGILYRQFVRPDGTLQFLQVVVPRSLRTQFLDAVHTGPINGHFGMEKTRLKLQEIAYWQGWSSDVQTYIRRCHVCASYRHGPRQKQGQLQCALACDVMQKVHIDLVGPFPLSRRGYRYLLTVICSFTKYLICVPIRDKLSLTVTNALMKNVYLVYGLPEVLVHDQGGEFFSDVMQQLAKLLEIQPSKITSHRPNANGVVERVHSTLHRMFAKMVASNQRDWCEMTSYLTHAYNVACHGSTTFSPFYLMFLRHPKMPIELQIAKSTAAAIESQDEYVELASQRMREAYDIVRSQLKTSFDRAKKRYDCRVKTASFKEGQFVWYYIPRNRRGYNRKWELNNRGPYRVMKKLNDVNFIIQRTQKTKPIVAHIDRLSLYYGQTPAEWENNAARQPANESANEGNSDSVATTNVVDEEPGLGPRDPGTVPLTKFRTARKRKHGTRDGGHASLSGGKLSSNHGPRNDATPKRARHAPARLADYVFCLSQDVVEERVLNSCSGLIMNVPINCPECGHLCKHVRSVRKHAVLHHRMRFCRLTMTTEPFPTEEEAEQAYQQTRRSQLPAHRRRRVSGAAARPSGPVVGPSSAAARPSGPVVGPSSAAVGPSGPVVGPLKRVAGPSSLDVGPSKRTVGPSGPVVEPSSTTRLTGISRRRRRRRRRPASPSHLRRLTSSEDDVSPSVSRVPTDCRHSVSATAGGRPAGDEYSSSADELWTGRTPSDVSSGQDTESRVSGLRCRGFRAAESQRAGPTAPGMRLPEAAEDLPPSEASAESMNVSLSGLLSGDEEIPGDWVEMMMSGTPFCQTTDAATQIDGQPMHHAAVQARPSQSQSFAQATPATRTTATDADMTSRRRLFDIPAGVCLREVIQLTRRQGADIGQLLEQLLETVQQNVTEPQRDNLRDLLVLVAATRRDQAQQAARLVADIGYIQDLLPHAASPAERLLFGELAVTTEDAAHWNLSDEFLDEVQPPLFYCQSTPDWSPVMELD